MKCGNLFGDLKELENTCRTTIGKKLFNARYDGYTFGHQTL
jgi:hypothetical protein